MTTWTVKDADGHPVSLEKPLVPGRSPAASSRPVALSTEDKAVLDSIDGKMGDLKGYTDGLETLLGLLNGYVDGLETLIGTSNSSLTTLHGDVATTLAGLITSLNGYVDGLEALQTSSNSKLDSIHTDLATTLSGLLSDLKGYTDALEGYTDGIEGLIGTTNTALTTLQGYVDGLEGLITTLNGKLDTLHTDLTEDRSFFVAVNFTQAASYSGGQSMGPTGAGNAKIALDITAAAGVSMVNAKARLVSWRYNLSATTVTAAAAMVMMLFPAAPAGTFTDAAAPTTSAAENAANATSLALGICQNLAAPNAGTNVPGLAQAPTIVAAQGLVIVCDGSGKLYLVVQAAGTHTYATPSGFNLVLEFKRA